MRALEPPATGNRGEWGGASVAFRRLLTAAAFVALLGAVGYLAAQLHHRQYRLRAEGHILVVERGRRFPVGFEAYVPDDKAVAPAYTPVTMPPFAESPVTQTFEDRDALDRALFTLLTSWAGEALKRAGSADAVAAYVRRAEALPGLTEQQHQELREFRGTVAVYTAQSLLEQARERLEQARNEISLAAGSRAAQTPEARRIIGDIERYLVTCLDGESPAETAPQSVTPAPPLAPAANAPSAPAAAQPDLAPNGSGKPTNDAPQRLR